MAVEAQDRQLAQADVSHSLRDSKAFTKKGKRRWNRSFSPLEVGKEWFYKQIEAITHLETRQGYETWALRQGAGLKKLGDKMSEAFEAHCIDSWVLANWWVGGHNKPDNTAMLLVAPLHFHRRQLHRLQPEAGGIRKPYGGTRSVGFKRGSLIKHAQYGLIYVGGYLKGQSACTPWRMARGYARMPDQKTASF